jgi:23S rRNA (guanine745-N1)-methyltransferase
MERLARGKKSMTCPNGHSFDFARSGYVNLLMSQQSGKKQHGDGRAMIRARRAFLDRGYYSDLRDALSGAAADCVPDGGTVLDAGCGECYYTAAVAEKLRSLGRCVQVFGIDISRDALMYGAKRGEGLLLAVSSIFRLPMSDKSCDLVMNVFAPSSPQEYHRVLKTGGFLASAVPLEMHLWELKTAVYDRPYMNDAPSEALDGFMLIKKTELRKTIHLENGEDIKNLFSMTPYARKTGKGDMARLEKLNELYTATEFGLYIYQKM